MLRYAPCSGTHHHQSCNENAAAEKVKGQLESYRPYLFPASLTLPLTSRGNQNRVQRNFGGWGDPRDHKLCLSFVRH